MRRSLKTAAGLVASIAPQARYPRMIFVLSHMRSVSTALSNVLCSHSDVSGYGETHVAYGQRFAPGRVVINLVRRRAYQGDAPFLLDKVLHNRLDEHLPDKFYSAKAVFLLRKPYPAILSTVRLARITGLPDLQTAEAAALYYLHRLERLETHWSRFPESLKRGYASEELRANPEQTLRDLGDYLGLSSPLTNAYRPNAASNIAGGGDPIKSGHARRIISDAPQDDECLPVGLSKEVSARCVEVHLRLANKFRSAKPSCG